MSVPDHELDPIEEDMFDLACFYCGQLHHPDYCPEIEADQAEERYDRLRGN